MILLKSPENWQVQSPTYNMLVSPLLFTNSLLAIRLQCRGHWLSWWNTILFVCIETFHLKICLLVLPLLVVVWTGLGERGYFLTWIELICIKLGSWSHQLWYQCPSWTNSGKHLWHQSTLFPLRKLWVSTSSNATTPTNLPGHKPPRLGTHSCQRE